MIRIERLQGERLRQEIPSLAELRIEIFRAFPYLYEGSLDYEKKYLERYIKSSRCAVIAAYDTDKNNQMIGAATALPLAEEMPEIQKPFLKMGMKLSEVYYFGESVLRSEYRGQGLGHQFFDEREKVALEDPHTRWTSFCAVVRSNHPLMPKDYRPLDEFWKKRGYTKHSEMTTQLSWQDLDQTKETAKEMIFWLKAW